MQAHVYIGTSGWNYTTWKHDFYAGVARKNWLRFYAKRFPSVEVNATFYRLQSPGTLARWCDETPADFRFAIKANRYLTHTRKLNDPKSPVQREREQARHLDEKLAVVIWQLPASLQKNLEKLERFAEVLDGWRNTRHSVEFRHTSWFDEEVTACMRAHRLAVCMSDAADWPLWEAVTTDVVYVRLHGHTRTFASAYSAAQLDSWAKRTVAWIQEGRQVHVYFDNDAEGAAPRDALRLLESVNNRVEMRR